MSEERFNTITGIEGKRGSGKTLFILGSNYTSKEADKALKVPGLIDLYLTHLKKKVLIIDTFDHPAYRNIPIMPMDKFKDWKSGVYRMLTHADDIPKLIEFIQKHNSIWSTAIIFEDAYKHTSGAICKPLRSLLGDTKQKDIDVFFMYWSFGQMPPDIFRFLDFIECFKTNDSPEVRQSYMPGYFDEAMKVYNEVKAHPSKFYHKTIETGNS